MKLLEIKYTATLLCLTLIVSPACAERADRYKPVNLVSDQVHIDDAKQVSVFEGNVMLTQGTLTIRGDKLVVLQDAQGFSHGTATGQLASFRQKREGVNEYIEGYAERIEYDVASEIVDFFVRARMIRKRDEVRGDHITYNSITETFQVQGEPKEQTGTSESGRVRVTLHPKSKPPQESESLPIKASGTLTPANHE